MSTVTPKQRILDRLLTATKRDAEVAASEERQVLEQLLYAVCREGATRARADQAFAALHRAFFDWNEVRVSSVREVQEVLAGLPDPENRALRLLTLLQEVFESTYSFDLESLHKKGVKQAQKQLERYQGATPYAIAYTIQHGLGGHALPLDADMQRAMRRMELLEGPYDEPSQAALEHVIPKARGAAVCETLSHLAQEYCQEQNPACTRCPVHDACPTGQENLRRVRAGVTRSPSKVKAR